MGYYDTTQICLTGHMINDHSQSRPQHNQDFCDKCGQKTILACLECENSIRGDYETEGVIDLTGYKAPAPAFCEKRGKPYPWTESRLEATKNPAGLLDLDIPEETLLERSIEEMLRDTPRSPAEAVRFKRIAERAKPWALAAFKKILFGAVGEGVKKMIWP